MAWPFLLSPEQPLLFADFCAAQSTLPPHSSGPFVRVAGTACLRASARPHPGPTHAWASGRGRRVSTVPSPGESTQGIAVTWRRHCLAKHCARAMPARRHRWRLNDRARLHQARCSPENHAFPANSKTLRAPRREGHCTKACQRKCATKELRDLLHNPCSFSFCGP